MKNHYWFRKGADVRVCFVAVVVNAKFRQFPNQSDQIETTPVIPFTNLDLGNVVPTPLNSGAHACNVELRCIEAKVPNTNLNSRLQRSLQQSWDCVAPKGRLECEVQSFSDCTFQQSFAFMPCGTVGVFLDNGWIRSKNAPSSLVWIEIFNSMLQQGSAANAAFAGAVCSG
jgi:hypothetical protein